MIKYSLVVLAATAVIMSSGCDDSECCATGSAPVVVKNVAPVVSTVFGLTNNSTKTCTPGSTINLTANATDANSNLDTSTYSWVEKVGTNENSLGRTIVCPGDGVSTKVCTTVEDKKGLKSNEVCVNLKGKASAPAPVATCPALHIKATDLTTNYTNHSVTDSGDIAGGHSYNFNYNWEDGASCPDMSCSWYTLKSASAKSSNNDKVCINEGKVTNQSDHIIGLDENTTNITVSTIRVHTCGKDDYNKITAVVRCTNSKTNEHKDTTAVFTVVSEDDL